MIRIKRKIKDPSGVYVPTTKEDARINSGPEWWGPECQQGSHDNLPPVGWHAYFLLSNRHYVCMYIFPSIYKCPLESTGHSQFLTLKREKKLHSNSRLFVKSITDLYMDFIYNIYINILIYIIYENVICIFDDQAEHMRWEALWGTVWAYGSALSRAPSLPWGRLSHKFLFLSNITSQGQFPSSAFSSYSSLKFGFTPTSLSSFQWKTIYFYSVDLSAKPSLVNGRQWLNLIKIWMQYKSKTRTGEFSNHTDKAPATIKNEHIDYSYLYFFI